MRIYIGTSKGSCLALSVSFLLLRFVMLSLFTCNNIESLRFIITCLLRDLMVHFRP